MYILYLLLALVILLVMVTIHEFGHYVAGKMLGFKINEFSIGFGKALFSKTKKNGEVFSIRLVPLGGYCAFEGEEEDSDNDKAFMKQAPWKRLIVLFSGAFFNFLSAIIFTVILLCAVGYDIPQIHSVNNVVQINEHILKLEDIVTEINDEKLQINGETRASISAFDLSSYLSDNIEKYNTGSVKVSFLRNGFEQEATITFDVKNNNFIDNSNGLKENDIVLKINGVSIDFVKDNLFSQMINKNSANKDVTLTVKRNGRIVDVKCNYLNYGIPYQTYKNENGDVITYQQYEKLSEDKKVDYFDNGYMYSKIIGVSSSAYKFSFGESLVKAVPYTFGFAFKVLQSLWQLITGQLGLSAVGGPITTITTMASFTQSNFSTFFVLLPLIAANLAVFNWLPIPALDGSKMLLTIVEMIRKKPLNPKVENMIHTVGLIVLFGLVIVADVYHLIFG